MSNIFKTLCFLGIGMALAFGFYLLVNSNALAYLGIALPVAPFLLGIAVVLFLYLRQDDDFSALSYIYSLGTCIAIVVGFYLLFYSDALASLGILLKAALFLLGILILSFFGLMIQRQSHGFNTLAYIYHICRGLVRFCLNDNQGAIEDYNQAIRLNPDDAHSYTNRGDARSNLGDHQGAIEDYNQAIHLDTNSASGYFARGAIRCYIGDRQGAIEDFTELIRLKPNANSYYNRGVTHYQMGNYQEAIADLTQTLQLKPNDVTAYYNRGNAKYDLGDEPGAFQDYNQAQAIAPNAYINPNDEHGYYGRGLARSRMGDNKGAREDLHKAAIICSEHRHTDLYQKVQEAIKKLSD